MQIPKLSYEQVRSAYKRLAEKHPEVAAMTLPEFSRYMNEELGTTAFSAGDENWLGYLVKELAYHKRKFVEPVAKVTREVGRGLGSLVGPRTAETLASTGESLPHLASTIALAAIPKVGLPLAMSSMAGETYEQTDSVPAALVAGASLPAGFGAMGLARKKVAETLAKRAVPLSKGLTRAAEYGAAQAALGGTMEASSQLQSFLAGRGFYNPFEPEQLGQAVATQALFGLLDLPAIRGVKMSQETGKPTPLTWREAFKKAEDIPGYMPTLTDVYRAGRFAEDVISRVREAEAGAPGRPFREPPEAGTSGKVDVTKTEVPSPPGSNPLWEAYKSGTGPGSDLDSVKTARSLGVPFTEESFMRFVEEYTKADPKDLPELLARWREQSTKPPIVAFREDDPLPGERAAYYLQYTQEKTPSDPRVKLIKDAMPDLPPEVFFPLLEGKLVAKLGPGGNYVFSASVGKEGFDLKYQISHLDKEGKIQKEVFDDPQEAIKRLGDIKASLPEGATADLSVLRIPKKGGDTSETPKVQGKEGEEVKPSPQSFGIGDFVSTKDDDFSGDVIAVDEGGVSVRDWHGEVRKLQPSELELRFPAQRKKTKLAFYVADLREEGKTRWIVVHAESQVPLAKAYATEKEATIAAAKHSAAAKGVKAGEEAWRVSWKNKAGEDFVFWFKNTPQGKDAAELLAKAAKALGHAAENTLTKKPKKKPGAEGESALDESGGVPSKEPGVPSKEPTGEPGVPPTTIEVPPTTPGVSPETPSKKSKETRAGSKPSKGSSKSRPGASITTTDTWRNSFRRVVFRAVANGADQAKLNELAGYWIKEPEKAMLQFLEAEDALLRKLATEDAIKTMAFARDYFYKTFLAQGEPEAQAKLKTRVALRLIARFSKVKLPVEFQDMPQSVPGQVKGMVDVSSTSARVQLPPPKKGEQFDQLLVTAAHELGHVLVKTAHSGQSLARNATKALHEAVNALAKTKPEDAYDFLHVMHMLLSPEEAVLPSPISPAATMSDAYANEFLSEFAGLLALGFRNGKGRRTLQELLQFSKKELRQLSFGIFREVTDVWDAALEWLKTRGHSRTTIEEFGRLRESLSELLNTAKQAEEVERLFYSINETRFWNPNVDLAEAAKHNNERYTRIVPGEVGDKVTFHRIIKDYEHATGLRDVGGRRIRFLDWVKPMAQFVQDIRRDTPSAVPFFLLGLDYPSIVSNHTSEILSRVWVGPNGKFDWQRLRWLGIEGTKQHKAFNEIALRENERVGKEGATSLMTRKEREEFSPTYRSLSEEDKYKIDLSLHQFAEMSRLSARIQVDMKRKSYIELFARRLQSKVPDMYDDEARWWVHSMFNLFIDLPTRPSDFDQQLEGLIRQLVSPREAFKGVGLKEDAAKAILRDVQALRNVFDKFQDLLLGPFDPFTGKRPGKAFYMPEVRYLEWHVTWSDKNGQRHLEHYRTREETGLRLQKLREQESRGEIENVRAYNRLDKNYLRKQLPRNELLESFAREEEAYIRRVLDDIIKEDVNAEEFADAFLESYVPGAGVREAEVSPYLKPRDFVPGRETINMVEGFLHYNDAIAHKLAREYVKQGAITIMNNPDMRRNPAIRNRFMDWVEFVVNPEGKEWVTLKNLIFFNYLGLNPSSLLVEACQQLLTVAPGLIREFPELGIKNSYAAIKDAIQTWGKGERESGRLVFKDDPILTYAFQRAENEAVINTGFLGELYGERDFEFARSRSFALGSGILGESRDVLLRKPLYQLLSFARNFYGLSTQFNSAISFIAAFKNAMKRHKGNVEKAYIDAKLFNATTLFGGGRVVRPAFLQGMGNWTGLGGVIYALNSYTFNTIFMMARLFKEAIGRETLSPAERRAAMKGAGMMFGTQVAFAGLLGLPMVGGLLTAIDKLYPEAEVRANLREAIASMFTDDQELGLRISDAVLTGAFSASPLELGARFSLGSAFGVSAYEGFSWQNLAGPAASMLENWYKGLSAALQGNFREATYKLLPVGLRNVVRSVVDDGAIRDQRERLIGNLTPFEHVSQALGFTPKRMSDFYTELALQEGAKKAYESRSYAYRNEIANRILKGDIQGAKKILDSMEPEYDPADMLRSAVELAQERKYPRDVTAHVPKGMAERALRLHRLFPSWKERQPTETERLLERKNIEAKFGYYGTGVPTTGELIRAALADEEIARGVPRTLARYRAQEVLRPY